MRTTANLLKETKNGVVKAVRPNLLEAVTSSPVVAYVYLEANREYDPTHSLPGLESVDFESLAVFLPLLLLAEALFHLKKKEHSKATRDVIVLILSTIAIVSVKLGNTEWVKELTHAGFDLSLLIAGAFLFVYALTSLEPAREERWAKKAAKAELEINKDTH